MGLFGKSKRVRLGEAVRASCRPLLYEMGFRNPRKHDRDRWSGTRLDIFLRWRGPDYDEVRIEWRTLNRPSFFIHGMSSKFERDSEGRPTEFRRLTYPGACSSVCRLCGNACVHFGPLQSVRRAVETANRGLQELNEYFLDGTVGPHISTYTEVRVGPGISPPGLSDWSRRFGDPALDPESDVARLSD
jgi:hypothetical protein